LHACRRTHGERPFKCDICGKRLSRNGSLVSHMRIHNGEKPFQCKVCKRRYYLRSSLVAHYKQHSSASLSSASGMDKARAE
jgi:KRAB domain-containing zinc finger protein